ncbi:MAG: phosphatase PAP2 family protein [Gammaproteobacteria bacterium]|nr:phosphatase PAP2 family protein [Gammaproteobacteria bacterium]
MFASVNYLNHWDWDVSIVEFLNKITADSKFLQTLFKLISYLGTEYVFIAIFAVLYWLIDKKIAKDVGYGAFYGMVLNNGLKSIFNFLRPFQQKPSTIKCLDESILAKDVNGNFLPKEAPQGTYLQSSSTSFPSGHSQGASGVYNSLAKSFNEKYDHKIKWVWAISICLSILVMVSRIALGVHSFIDVFTGFAVGLCMIELVSFGRKKFKNETIFHIIMLSALGLFTFLAPLWSEQTRDMFTTYGVVAGCFVGFILEEKYVNFKISKVWWKNVVRLLFGVVTVVGLKIVLKLPYSHFVTEGTYLGNVLDMIRYFLMIVGGVFAMPLLMSKIPFLKDDEEQPQEVKEEEVKTND